MSETPRPTERPAERHTSHVVIDAEHFDRTMGMVMQRLEEMRDTQAASFAAALGSVGTDRELLEKIMGAVAEVAQKRAAEATGRGLWWLLKSAVSKWLVVAFIVLLVARAAGIDAAKAIWQVLKVTN